VAERYLIALGSNVRHHRHGLPPMVVRAALAELNAAGLRIERASRIVSTVPLGPSLRRYANAATILVTDLPPDALLRRLKQVEREFGRRRGRRWAARVLDLDVILWEGGTWRSPGLTVPHAAFRRRRFVLEPAAAIAPRWRDPVSGLTLRQLAGRLRIS
jgi:2-amino-4-hydroxy-6-hydroxymethyldihydropteridine diphosphokinase